MAEKKVKIPKERMFKPNPDDSPNSGAKPNLERKPVIDPILTGGCGDDICGNSPRFPKDPRFKENFKGHIQQVKIPKENIAKDNMRIKAKEIIKK